MHDLKSEDTVLKEIFSSSKHKTHVVKRHHSDRFNTVKNICGFVLPFQRHQQVCSSISLQDRGAMLFCKKVGRGCGACRGSEAAADH